MPIKQIAIILVLGVVVAGFILIFGNGQSADQDVSSRDVSAAVKEEAGCTCGCGYTLENCKKYDPNCPVRPGINKKVDELAEEGKTKEEILNILNGGSPVESAPKNLFNSEDPLKGDKDAPVTIVEFSDFQCPFCAKFYSDTFSKIEKEYIQTGKVNLVYRDFPLSFHGNAQKAAEAAECAQEQGKFWDYHDLLFENQPEWSSGGIGELKNYAKEINLNSEEFNECLDSGAMKEEVEEDFQEGSALGVSGTPAFFINGELISGAQPFSVFKEVIEENL